MLILKDFDACRTVHRVSTAGQTVTTSQIVALEKFHHLFPDQHGSFQNVVRNRSIVFRRLGEAAAAS